MQRAHQYPAWEGSDTDFRRLMTVIQDAIYKYEPQFVTDATEWRESAVRAARERLEDARLRASRLEADGPQSVIDLGSYEKDLRKNETELEESRIAASQRLALSVQITSAGDITRTASGSSDELAVWLEGKAFLTLSVDAPNGAGIGSRARLVADSDGLYVSVSSTDPDWTQALFSNLEEEIKGHIPRWRFIRSYWLLVPLFGIATSILVYTILDILAKFTTESGKYDSTTQVIAGAGVVIWGTLGGTVGARTVRRFVPAFELTTGRGKGRGGALITILLTSVGSIALSILANVLTDLLTT